MSDTPNPFIARWLGKSGDFDQAIESATGKTKEQRQKEFDESFNTAKLKFELHGFTRSHPIILEPIATEKVRELMAKGKDKSAYAHGEPSKKVGGRQLVVKKKSIEPKTTRDTKKLTKKAPAKKRNISKSKRSG